MAVQRYTQRAVLREVPVERCLGKAPVRFTVTAGWCRLALELHISGVGYLTRDKRGIRDSSLHDSRLARSELK